MLAAMNRPIATITSIAKAVSYVVIDIETADAPEEAIALALEAWRPGPNAKTADEINAEADNAIASWTAPLNIKDPAKIEERRAATLAKIEAERTAALEKIVARKDEAIARIRERSALLDAAPIICVGAQTDSGSAEFNGMNLIPYKVGGVPAVACGDERGLLLELRAWLDSRTNPDTVIVGQNVKGFDLPKLRNAYTRYRLQLPNILTPRLPGNEVSVVDTAMLFKSFSVEHRDDFCPSLDAVCAGLGIPKPKSVVSGADVPRMYREGRYEEILIYNAIDREATTKAYLLMSGQAIELN